MSIAAGYGDKDAIIFELQQQLQLNAEEIHHLRASRDVVAEALGCSDEPRAKWMTLEIWNIKRQLRESNEALVAAQANIEILLGYVSDYSAVHALIHDLTALRQHDTALIEAICAKLDNNVPNGNYCAGLVRLKFSDILEGK